MEILWLSAGIVFGICIGILVAIKKYQTKPKLNVPSKQNTEKIMRVLNKNNKITNSDVQKVLGVSDATATRYLDGMEQKKLLTQQGKTGRGTFYTKT